MPDKVQTMAYVGETPWHGKGKPVKKNTTTDEMLVDSGLDWPVELADVEYTNVMNKRLKAAGFKVMYRGDTGEVFDIVGGIYQPTQNREVLHFFKEYVETGEMTLATAGSLSGGKQVWAQANMEASFMLPGKDEVKGYVLLMNPHQYGKGMIAKFCATRVVCWNTMTAALGEAGGSVKIWHNRKFDEEAQQDAKRKLGIARERFDAFKEQATRLSLLELTVEQAVEVAAFAFKADPKKPLKEQGRTVKRIITLYEGEGKGASLKSAAGTGWGLLNAVTQYLDWEYGRTQDRRLVHAWMGGGEAVKRRAMGELLELAPKLTAG